jgi:hypothetical protein
MESELRPVSVIADAQSAVSWAAIAAGAVATAALTLLLVAFGAGIGFSAISPWSNTGVSTSTFEVGTGIYLIIIAVMSSAVGGYLAGRLRTKWVGLHSNEVYFRDTAHGMLAWAFATLISATALASTTAYLANGAMAGAGAAAAQTAQSNPADIYVDKLLRPVPGQAASGAGGAASGSGDNATGGMQTRGELRRLWIADFGEHRDISANDKTYIAQVVAARTGMSQADAQKRVDEVVAEAKTAADNARRGAAHLSFWLTAALLFGAFAASLAAAEGGTLRDGTWNGRVLTPRAI